MHDKYDRRKEEKMHKLHEQLEAPMIERCEYSQFEFGNHIRDELNKDVDFFKKKDNKYSKYVITSEK